MKISIIVPVYNSSLYLKDCLNSLLNQTIKDIEIIAIDDNSIDDSLNILKDLEQKYYGKLKVYHNSKNLGQSVTRNKGIELAKGEYIGFVDSDDYVNNKMYQTMYEEAVLNNYPEVIITGLCFVKDNYYLENNFSFLNRTKGKIINSTENPDFILNQSPSSCNKLFRSDIVKNNLFLQCKMWEDVSFTYSKLFNAKRILYFNNLDYFYRKKGNSGVSSKGFDVNKNLLDIFAVADQIEIETKKTNRYKLFEKEIRFIQITTCLQRVTEIMNWNISDVSKEKLCVLMCNFIIKKYGYWNIYSPEELSSKIGITNLDRINELVNKNKINSNDLEKEIIKELNR